jgi:excisionase family DNA binding protein
MIRLMKKADVAKALGVSIKTVDKWIQDKRIPFIRISRKCVRFNPIEVQRFLDERTTKETVGFSININNQKDHETENK